MKIFILAIKKIFKGIINMDRMKLNIIYKTNTISSRLIEKNKNKN
jgi:hypothetical protein